MAGYIREQYGVKDVVDDQGILNTFTLWLQGVHHKTRGDWLRPVGAVGRQGQGSERCRRMR